MKTLLEAGAEADIERLAVDIGRLVVMNRIVSIWEPNDYRHVLIP